MFKTNHSPTWHRHSSSPPGMRFLFILTTLLCAHWIYAQPSSNTSFSATNSNSSDYQVVLSWTYNNSYCDCNQSTNLDVTVTQSGGNTIPSNFLGSSLSDLTENYPCGPGQSMDFDWSFHFTGRRQWTGDGCTVFATCLADCNCDYTFSGSDVLASTSALKAPTGVTATDGVYDTKIIISWTKGTNVPDNLHQYRIYRDNVLIATVAGSNTSYENTGLTPGSSYNYTVKTYTPASSFGLAHESTGASDMGSTFTMGLEASDGDFYNRCKLSWNDVADIADDLRVERSIPGSMDREELAILSGNARAYNDQDGIPGYNYTYYITPIATGQNFLTDNDPGYSRPNGKISGHVKSQLNAGVSGVDINVTLLSTIPTGGFALPTCSQTYCAVTDAEGYYEIKDIYYYDGAEFRVVPYKLGTIPHEFSPDTINRTLDENTKTANGVDFTDLTVFTVAGRVTYPESSNNVTCGVEGVKILLDGADYGILTDDDGEWSFAIQDEGTYTFEASYLHHEFEDGDGNAVSSILVNADMLDIDFEDQTTDDLLVKVQGGCEASLGDSVEIHVAAPGNCFNETYYTNADGYLLIEDLPARLYTVEVTDIYDVGNTNISNIMAQIGNIPIEIDLTVRDTAQTITENDTVIITPMSIDTLPNDSIIVIPADTMEIHSVDTTYGDVAPAVNFIYRSPIEISTNWEDAGADVREDCQNSAGEDIILMEQGLSYIVQFEVKEILGMDCYIDTGFLKIYDFVSDRGGVPVKVPIIGGIATYVIDAGIPVVSHNPTFHDHEKLLYIIPEIDLITPEPVEYWVFVTGTKSNTPSFITRTPEIPMIILHDPPGDNSYAFIEKGTTYSHFTANEVLVGGEAGFYLNLLLGAKVLTPFSGNGFGTQIKFSASAGRDNFDRDGIFTEITFNERFQTPDHENLTGHDGDVYIGAAFNQEFSLAQALTFDIDSCKGDVDIVPSLAVEDFATTFVYTEKHIRNTLMPTIGLIKNNIIDGRPFNTLTLEEQAQVNNLIADSLLWADILNQNRLDRDSLATFKENISFSAGAQISKESSSDSVRMKSYEYNRFVNLEFGLGAKIDNESGIWFDSELGVMGKFRFASSVNEGRDTSFTRTVGYILDDNDIGDFFSVDILEDTSYSVPAFRLKLGTSSCPQEPGTQARDRATIQILPPEITNIPPGEAANFLCQITNESESFETREYGVRVVPTTNPDGMIVTLAGQWIGSGEGTFFLEPNQTKNLVLSFDQGPLASTYENVGVMVYPTCEYPLWQDNGNLTNSDTAWITRIEWQSQCTDIALHLPDDGWLVNQQSNNQIHCAFTGYDANNELFQSMTIQIKKEGEGYVDQITVDKDDIIGPFYDVFLDVTNFPDGNYRLRAKAYCGIDGGITYSSEKLGIIDRSSIAPFGTPTPSDGFLREGQEVSVTFDKLIDCDIDNYTHEITLIREDNQMAIPFTTSCFGNKLIINTTPPLIDQLSLEGVMVTARVHMLQDLNGNVQEYPTEWSFLVNVSPVFWDPENLVATGHEGQHNTIQAVMKNTSLLSKPFSLDLTEAPTIIEYPDWLTPTQMHGTILPNHDFVVTFDVSDELPPGIYNGTISAMVDSLPVSMTLTYELLAKPVNWNFNPSAYQYSMTMVAQFSLDGGNTNLSTDTRDIIAAFVNGEIRGLTNIEYLPGLNKYRAFLTIYSNDQGGPNGEKIKFKFWRALTGVEYGALETVTFVLDNTVGTVTTPTILHPEGFFQLIPLNKGWNWISFNVLSNPMSREHVFENLLNSPTGNSLTIKSKTQTSQYSPQSGWNGNLSTLALGPGYLINLSNAPDTLRVVGLPSASTIVVNVASGWNWIGFPRLNPESVDAVLEDLTPVTGNILKSQDRFASYDAGLDSWVGNLSFFSPGKGYKLNLSGPGAIIFDPSRGDEYGFDPYEYEYNMNVTGFADLDLIGEHVEDKMIVGAFIDGKCRGTGTMEWIDGVGEYQVLMLVNGNVADLGKSIEFRFKNEETGAEYITNGERLYFTADGLIGTVEQPYPFFTLSTGVEEVSSEGYHLEQCRPNPAGISTEIGFRIPERQQVAINLYDVPGNLIKTVVDAELSAGRHTYKVDLSELPKGVYFYEMKTSTFTGVKKLVRE